MLRASSLLSPLSAGAATAVVYCAEDEDEAAAARLLGRCGEEEAEERRWRIIMVMLRGGNIWRQNYRVFPIPCLDPPGRPVHLCPAVPAAAACGQDAAAGGGGGGAGGGAGAVGGAHRDGGVCAG